MENFLICLRFNKGWYCIAHLSAEDTLKSAVTEEKKIKNIESE